MRRYVKNENDMIQVPDVFLDTSALFAGIWSEAGGARMLLKLGEAQAVRLNVSPQVLNEIEGVLRRKSPQSLGSLALLLDRSRIVVVHADCEKWLSVCKSLVDYSADAIVLAAAWTGGIDYFATLDRKDFLNNQPLQDAAPFPVGTPGDCLAWYRHRF